MNFIDNRRDFLAKSGIAALGMVLASNVARADDDQASGKIVVTSEIANNHSHTLVLTEADVIKLLRQTNLQGQVQASIQGESRHAHTLTFTVLNLLDLLIGGSIGLVSSTEGSHNHAVTIKLDVQA